MNSALYKLIKPYSFPEYIDLVNSLATAGKSTGEESIERIEATKLNAQRMKRIHKTFLPEDSTRNVLSGLSEEWDWILIAESWCGDGAQNIPVVAKIAALSPHIHLALILRDENDEIMNRHLTNGTRSIPKLICLKSDTKEVLGEWGPRTAVMQQMVKEYKANNPEVPHQEFLKKLHLWYAKDKGLSMEHELVDLVQKWNKQEVINIFK